MNENQKEQKNIEGTPYWDNIGKKQLPFLSLTDEDKKNGFRIKFLTDSPRKQTESRRFDENNPKPELWFDVEANNKKVTWTISQVSLLVELKNHAPISGKSFEIKLKPVDEDFKKKNPRYKGSTRYEVTEVNSDSQPIEELVN
jgi:hypothetical protein